VMEYQRQVGPVPVVGGWSEVDRTQPIGQPAI